MAKQHKAAYETEYREPRTPPEVVPAPAQTPTLADWQAHAADLARRLAAAEARVSELEAPMRKQVYCFGSIGVTHRITAVSVERARALLPADAADATYRGCA